MTTPIFSKNQLPRRVPLLAHGLLFWAVCLACCPLFSQKFTLADTLLANKAIEDSRQLNREGHHAASLEKAQLAHKIRRAVLGENHIKTVFAQLYVARQLRELERPAEAIPLIVKSLPFIEATKNATRIAMCHHQWSMCLQKQGRFAEARQQLAAATAALPVDTGEFRGMLTAFLVTESAIFLDEKNAAAALPILARVKARFLEDKDQRGVGEASYYLGNAYFFLRDFERAKEQYLTSWRALQIAEMDENHSYFADLAANIGRCAQQTGEPELGLQYLLEAKKSYLCNDPEGFDYRQFLQYFGQFYLDENRPNEAFQTLDTCLQLKEKDFGPRSPQLLQTLFSLGEAQLLTGRFAEAERSQRRALGIVADSFPGGYGLAFRFYLNIAKIRLETGRPAACLLLCDSAFALGQFDFERAEQLFPRENFRDLCQTAGRAHVQLYQAGGPLAELELAEKLLALAAKILFLEIHDISLNGAREQFFDRDHRTLEQWLDAEMALFAATHDPVFAEKAFQISEKSKAFVLNQAMHNSGAIRFAGLPDSLLQGKYRLDAHIAEAEKTLLETPQADPQLDTVRLNLNRKLTAWREENDRLLGQIHALRPDYFRATDGGTSTRDFREQLLAPDQALLHFGLTETQIHVFVLRRDTFVARSFPRDFSLDSAVDSFKLGITAYHSAANPSDDLYDRSLAQLLHFGQLLYQKLVAPVAALLPSRVTVIPEGNLCLLPFEALLGGPPTDEGNFKTYPFLARNKVISYCYSADLLAQLARPPAERAARNWLGIAPFAFAENGGNAEQRFVSLPFSGPELGAIFELFRGKSQAPESAAIWQNEEASTARFRDEAPNFRVLHLATHSRADERMGDFSFLALSPTGVPMPARDLYQMHLAAELVVLSSCESGGGRLNRGEGIIGLVRAFAFAGARSVVASTWVANDSGTAAFMRFFYQNLLAGQAKDLALNAARFEFMRRSPAEAHPFFWTGFRVFGGLGACDFR